MKRLKLLGIDCEVDVWNTATGKERIKIYTIWNQRLNNELKEMDNARYEGREGQHHLWTVRLCARNIFTIDVLSGGLFNGSSSYYSRNSITNFICSPDDCRELYSQLWQHQKEAYAFKITHRRCIDAGEMGIGKTISTLLCIQYYKTKGFLSCWWIGPNSGLTSLRTQLFQWKLKSIFRSGDKIFNYHSLEHQLLSGQIPQIAIFDECHALKNSSARRTQLAMQLTEEMEKQYGNECIVIGLTGTPAPENHFDWWSIIEVIRPGWFREATINKYKCRIAEFGRGERIDGGSYPKFLGWKTKEVELLPKRLEGLVLVTWKRNCLDLPEKVYEEIQLPYEEKDKRIAKLIVKQSTRAIEAQIRLREYSDGFQYSLIPCEDCNNTGYILDKTVVCPSCGGKGRNRETTQGQSPKESALQELLEEYKENFPHRIVIYAAFTESVDKVTRICQEGGWNVWKYDGRGQVWFPSNGNYMEQTETSRFLHPEGTREVQFQNVKQYKYPIAFVGNPEAAGQGLTLTPSPAIIYYSNSFKSQYRVQSEDRIHRPGADKERGCKIIDLLWLPTDTLVLRSIKSKREVESHTLEEIEHALL